MNKNEKAIMFVIGIITFVMLINIWGFIRLVDIVGRIQGQVNVLIEQHNKQIELLE